MANRSDRFFTWIWRLNGLLLLVLGLIGIAGALALILNIGLFWSRERPQQQLTQVAGSDLKAKNLRLADFRPIAGTGFLYAPLAPPSEYIGSGSSGGLGRAHNLLFFDVAAKHAHWLLPDNDHIIPSFSFLMNPPGPRYADDGEARRRDQVAIALLVELQAPEDSAGKSDRALRLAIASADGRNLTPIAQSMGGLLGYHQPTADSVLVFYASEGIARVLDVDLHSYKVRSDSALSAHE